MRGNASCGQETRRWAYSPRLPIRHVPGWTRSPAPPLLRHSPLSPMPDKLLGKGRRLRHRVLAEEPEDRRECCALAKSTLLSPERRKVGSASQIRHGPFAGSRRYEEPGRLQFTQAI